MRTDPKIHGINYAGEKAEKRAVSCISIISNEVTTVHQKLMLTNDRASSSVPELGHWGLGSEIGVVLVVYLRTHLGLFSRRDKRADADECPQYE